MKELSMVAETGPPTYKYINIRVISIGAELPRIDIIEASTKKEIGIIIENPAYIGIIEKDPTDPAYCFLGNGSQSISSGVLRDIARLLDGMNIDGEIRVR